MFEKIRRWAAAHPRLLLAAATLAALAPFLAKPFNVDDPMFIWAARQIQSHPLDPYGFNVNWYGWGQPMWSVMESPPLNSYCMALVAGIFGWGETGLHLAYLLPAVAVVLGTHRLAAHFCGRPVLAALVALFSPVFLVSANTVMCDVLLLAFWVWAAVFWVEGLAQKNARRLAASGVLMALAGLTKYNGFCLVPLLAAYGLASQRGVGRWLVCLLIPVAAGLVYETLTQLAYGHGLFSSAVGYSASTKAGDGLSLATNGLVALAFTGGCAATAVFYAPLVWRPRMLLAFGVGAVLLLLALGGKLMGNYSLAGQPKTVAEIQIAFWAAGGLGLLAMAAADVWRRRDAAALLLLLWVCGTFVFAGFVNWSVTGRSLLPLTPAVAILLARRLDRGKTGRPCAGIFLAAGAACALLVARGDYLLAQAGRQSAGQTFARYGRGSPTLWFEGHWGFQFYMEKLGAVPIDMRNAKFKNGDWIALPWNNTDLIFPLPNAVALAETMEIPKGNVVTTMAKDSGAGFYASVIGPLPFSIGSVPPDPVVIFSVVNQSPGTNVFSPPLAN